MFGRCGPVYSPPLPPSTSSGGRRISPSGSRWRRCRRSSWRGRGSCWPARILLAWARFREGAAPPSRTEWRTGLISGTLLLLGGNGGVAWAEQRVPSGVAALLVAVVPLWMVLLDWLRPGGHRPRLAGLPRRRARPGRTRPARGPGRHQGRRHGYRRARSCSSWPRSRGRPARSTSSGRRGPRRGPARPERRCSPGASSCSSPASWRASRRSSISRMRPRARCSASRTSSPSGRSSGSPRTSICSRTPARRRRRRTPT